MFYKKIVLLFLLSLSLYANGDDVETKELLEYTHVHVNGGMSFYAAEVYMKNFEDDRSYSVGLLLRNEKNTDTEFGIGYMKSGSNINSLLSELPQNLDINKDGGMLMFLNYKF